MSKTGKLIFYGIVIALMLLSLVMLSFEDTKTINIKKESAGITLGLVLSYILAGIGVLGILAIAVKNMIDKPKAAIKVGIGLGIIVVTFLIGYLVDAGTTTKAWEGFGVKTSGYSKVIGGSLIMMYISLIGGVLLIIFGPFLRFLKK